MDATARARLAAVRHRPGWAVILTGAGISAESGIPTFRGEDGYWTVGSREYTPQEIGTYATFRRDPDVVWQWYLYRRGACRRARPNPAHEALARLERALGDRYRLLTQNVDGLHLRAGSSRERTYQVHGNIDFMRCGDDCSPGIWPVPDAVGAIERGETVPEAWMAELVCPLCAARARPHVLWFDECYDEARFSFDSALEAARRAAVLVTVGTSASTNLPWHAARLAVQAGASLIDVNPEDNPFAEIARNHPEGAWVRATAADAVPELVGELIG